MSNRRKVPGDPSAGLVELSVTTDRLVIMSLFPPHRDPVELRLPPEAAAALGAGLIEASAEAESRQVIAGELVEDGTG